MGFTAGYMCARELFAVDVEAEALGHRRERARDVPVALGRWELVLM